MQLLEYLVLQDYEKIMVDELTPVQVMPLNILLSKSLLEALYAIRVYSSQGKPSSPFSTNRLLFSFGR